MKDKINEFIQEKNIDNFRETFLIDIKMTSFYTNMLIWYDIIC